MLIPWPLSARLPAAAALLHRDFAVASWLIASCCCCLACSGSLQAGGGCIMEITCRQMSVRREFVGNMFSSAACNADVDVCAGCCALPVCHSVQGQGREGCPGHPVPLLQGDAGEDQGGRGGRGGRGPLQLRVQSGLWYVLLHAYGMFVLHIAGFRKIGLVTSYMQGIAGKLDHVRKLGSQ